MPSVDPYAQSAGAYPSGQGQYEQPTYEQAQYGQPHTGNRSMGRPSTGRHSTGNPRTRVSPSPMERGIRRTTR